MFELIEANSGQAQELGRFFFAENFKDDFVITGAVHNQMGKATGWNRCWSFSYVCKLIFVIQIDSLGWHDPGFGRMILFCLTRMGNSIGTGLCAPVTSTEQGANNHVYHSADHPGSAAHWRITHMAV
jgi:hypothetical protein